MSDTKKWTPNDRQRAVLEKLRDEVEKAGGQAKFAREFSVYRDSTLNKILAALDPDLRRRSYFDQVKNVERCWADLEEFVSKIDDIRAERAQNAKDKLHPLSVFKAVLKSVRECRGRKTPNRLTKYIAGTGGGKTMLRRYLAEELRNEIPFHEVEARNVWRPNHRDERSRAQIGCLKDVSLALGMDIDDVKWMPKDIREREDDIKRHCTVRERVLFVDEAEFFHTYSLNFFKWLLNTSKLILLFGCSPTAHAKWNTWFTDEALQLARRTNAVFTPLSTANEKAIARSREDVALFFPDNQFEKRNESLDMIIEAAKSMGHFELIVGIAKRLESKSEVDLAEVEAAIDKALIPMSKQRRKAEVVR